MSATEDALKGLKFADLAKTVFGAGPEAGAVTTASGQLSTVSPDILRDLQGTPASAYEDVLASAAGGTGEAIVPEGASASLLGEGGLTGVVADALGISTGAAGSALGAAGAIPGIVLAALSDEPNWEKAVDSALLTAGGALAPFTYGTSALVAGVVDLLIHLFAKPGGDYIPQRREAFDIAKRGLGELGSTYQQAAESGNPAQQLQALQTTESGGHIRSGLNLPPEIARQLSLSVPPGSETVPVDWNSLSPQQFEQFLSIVGQQDPSVLGQWVTGSGDVPYLPQETAQSAADQASADAQAMLAYLVAQQHAPATGTTLAKAPQAPAAMSPGGGTADLEEITP